MNDLITVLFLSSRESSFEDKWRHIGRYNIYPSFVFARKNIERDANQKCFFWRANYPTVCAEYTPLVFPPKKALILIPNDSTPKDPKLL